MYIAISNCYLIKDNFNIHGLIFLNKGLRFPTNFWPLRRFEAKKCLRQPLLARKVGLSCVITVTNSSQVVIGQRLVMGPSLGPARARPGPGHFFRARARILGKGLGSGPARARCQSPGALEGLFYIQYNCFFGWFSDFFKVKKLSEFYFTFSKCVKGVKIKIVCNNSNSHSKYTDFCGHLN